jgi:predicted GIY-YIG superfamily endonuclease
VSESEIRKEQNDLKGSGITGETRDNLKDIIGVTSESEIRREQHERAQGYKVTAKDTRDNLRHYDDTAEDVTHHVRKEQQNDQDHKAAARANKESLADITWPLLCFKYSSFEK